MSKVTSSISRMIDRKTGSLPTQAIVVRVDQIQADLSFGVGTGVIHNAPIQGDPNLLRVGGVVAIQWVAQSGGYSYPVVIASAGGVPVAGMTVNMTVEPDNQTIENRTGYLAVKDYGIGLNKLSFSPSLEGHTHPGTLTGTGFSAGNGAFYSNNGLLRLEGSGKITVGEGNQSVTIDTTDPTYRLWAGSLYGVNAPFSVDKDGNIRSTAGEIGGWNIGANRLDADSGQLILNSETPFIGMGGAEAYGETGIWLGKDTDDVYKVFIGNAGKYLSWNGTDLEISGEIIASSGSIGGWTIAAEKLSSTNITLDSLNEFISIGGADEYLSDPGFWVGMDGGVAKMHIGDPDADFVSWDGNTLTVSGALFSAENIIGVIGGSMMITKDRGTFSVAITSSQATIDFGRTMTANDFILIKARNSAGAIATEYLKAGTLVSGTTYNVTRGLNGAGQDWPANTIFVVLGQSANDDGFIELDAYGSPEISVIRQLAAYNQTEKIVNLSAESGINIGVSGSYADDRAYTFTYNGSVVGGLYGLIAEETSFSFITKPIYNQPMTLNFVSQALTDEPSTINLRAYNQYAETRLDIGIGTGIWTNSYIRADEGYHAADPGDIIAGNDLVAMRSLSVGENERPIPNGSIRATGSFKLGSTSFNPTVSGQMVAKYLSLDNYCDLQQQSAAPANPSTGWGRIFVANNTRNSLVYKRSGGTRHDLTTDEVQMSMTSFSPLQGAAWEGAAFGNHMPNRMRLPNSQAWPAAAGGPYLIPLTWSGLTIFCDLYVMVGTNNSGSIQLGFNLYDCDDAAYTYNNANVLVTNNSIIKTGSWITYGIYKFTGSLVMPTLTRSKMVFAHLYRNSSDTYNNDVFFIGGKLRSYD